MHSALDCKLSMSMTIFDDKNTYVYISIYDLRSVSFYFSVFDLFHFYINFPTISFRFLFYSQFIKEHNNHHHKNTKVTTSMYSRKFKRK